MTAPTTRNLTILLTDIKGFTDKTSRKSRQQILDMLEKHKEIVLPTLTGKGGRLVKTIGDAFLMAYDSPTDAVLAGIAVQEGLRAYNEGREPDDRIEVRVAINCGEVNLSDDDVFGEPVNITARIEAVAEAGEVFFTEAVYLAMNKNEVPSSEVGLLQLKGIPEKVRVYKVKRETPVRQVSASVGIAPQSALRSPEPKAAHVPAAAAATPSPAPVISCAAIPSMSKRCAAAFIDVMLVWMLVTFVWPTGDQVRFQKKAGAATKVEFVKDGVKVDSKKANVRITQNGIDVEDSENDDPPVRRFPRFAVVWLLYSVLLLKRTSSTLGGRTQGLAVVRIDGKPLEKGDRWIRTAVSLVSLYCLGLGYLWALWEKDSRGWHDLAAGTRVVVQG